MEKENLLKMNLQLLAGEDDSVENTEDDVNVNGDTNNAVEKDVKKYSDDDVDRIIEKKFEKWKKQQQKEIDEAKKLADMNAQQKAEYERDKLQKELDELRNAKTIAEMSKTARNMLKEKDINIDDDLLSALVTKEAESTKTNVESFISLFEKAIEKAVNDRVKGKTPKKYANKSLTKAEILSIENKSERRKAILENLDLFD